MLDNNEEHSYLEIVDVIKQYGANPKNSLEELWRRIVFSILISNVDDHLRNHGFLYAHSLGWDLSPIYDVNPVPSEIRSRHLTTNITLEDNTASLDLALEVIEYFGIKLEHALNIVHEVGKAVNQWQKIAKKFE